MNERELAEYTIKAAKSGEERIRVKIQWLKAGVLDILGWLAENIAVVGAGIDTEDKFFRYLAELGDILWRAPGPIEAIDDKIIAAALRVLDRAVLDRLLGDNWFSSFVLPRIRQIEDFLREKSQKAGRELTEEERVAAVNEMYNLSSDGDEEEAAA